MPDHPTLSASFAVTLLHLFDDRLDTEELLMTGDLALAVIKEGERAGELQDPLLPAKGVENSILLSHRDHPGRPELIVVTSGPSEITREDVPQLIRRKGPIDQAANERIIMMLAPLQPELATRTDSGVERLVLVGRDQQLDSMEQRGDRSRRLVGDQLTDPFHDLHPRGLVFDHTERDTIDQQDDVAAARVGPVLLPDRLLILGVALSVVTVDRELWGSLEKVVLGLVPVDEAHRVALLVAFDRLRDRRTQD